MSYRKTSAEYCSANDKDDISYVIYEPADKEPVAVLQVVHDVCDYIERYEPLAHVFCEAGIAVCGETHLGHGEAALKNGTLGRFGEAKNSDFLTSDVKKLAVMMQRKYKKLPYFMLGQGMGALIVQSFIAKHKGIPLDGVVLCGTTDSSADMRRIAKHANQEVAKHGNKYISQRLISKFYNELNRPFKSSNSKYAHLTSALYELNRIEADPLCTFDISAGSFAFVFDLAMEVTSEEWFNKAPKELPILLAGGDEDTVGGMSKGITSLYDKLKAHGHSNVMLELYEGVRHDLFHEEISQQVFVDLLHYVMDKAEKQPPLIVY